MLSENGKVKILEKYIYREDTKNYYSDELSFYEMVKQGEQEWIQKRLQEQPFEAHVQTALSDDPLQSLKYHLAVSAAMLARFCIEGGMEYHRAYELSDYYIRMADRAKQQSEVAEINQRMCMEYAGKMRMLHKNAVFSKPIVKSIDYIYAHLHCRLTVAEVAAAIERNESYFSRLFQRETGVSVSQYILQRKMETAQNLLRYSDYTCAEIAELLSFSSQSHFTIRFHEACGMTPLAYRNRYYQHTGLSREKILEID